MRERPGPRVSSSVTLGQWASGAMTGTRPSPALPKPLRRRVCASAGVGGRASDLDPGFPRASPWASGPAGPRCRCHDHVAPRFPNSKWWVIIILVKNHSNVSAFECICTRCCSLYHPVSLHGTQCGLTSLGAPGSTRDEREPGGSEPGR